LAVALAMANGTTAAPAVANLRERLCCDELTKAIVATLGHTAQSAKTALARYADENEGSASDDADSTDGLQVPVNLLPDADDSADSDYEGGGTAEEEDEAASDEDAGENPEAEGMHLEEAGDLNVAQATHQIVPPASKREKVVRIAGAATEAEQMDEVTQRIASQTAERMAEQKAFNDSVKLENERRAREQSEKLEEIERQNLATAAAQLKHDEEERRKQIEIEARRAEAEIIQRDADEKEALRAQEKLAEENAATEAKKQVEDARQKKRAAKEQARQKALKDQQAAAATVIRQELKMVQGRKDNLVTHALMKLIGFELAEHVWAGTVTSTR
jgi:hypothetical protein